MANRGRKRVATKEAAAPPPKRATVPLQGPAPIERMDLVQLQEALQSEVMHQDDAVLELAVLAKRAWRHHRDPVVPTGQPHILKALLAGPSGVGKTESVQRLRYYLGQAKGWLWQRTFIEYDASTCQDSMSSSRLTGSSAGYVGYDNGTTLPDRLVSACESEELRAIMAMNLRSAEYREAYKAYKAREKRGEGPAPPPVLVLFIDEIDKAHPNFLVAINGLLDTGRMISPGGTLFELPQQTSLLCLFTSNFGDARIAQMKLQDPLEAQQYVEEAIARKGFQKCTLERFGKIVVYFAMTRDQLREVLNVKLEGYIARGHAITRRYGELLYDDEVKQFLVNHILQQSDYERGIRNGTRLLFENLDRLCEDALCAIERYMDTELSDQQPDGVGLQRGVPFNVFAHTFGLQDAEMQLQGALAPVMNTPVNRRQLALHRKKRCKTVQALGVKQDQTVVALSVIPSLVLACVAYADDTQERMGELRHQRRRLRDSNTQLKETLHEVFTLTEEAQNLTEARDQVRALRDRKRHLIVSVEEEQEDEEPVNERERFLQVARNQQLQQHQRQQRQATAALQGRVTELDETDDEHDQEEEEELEQEEEEEMPVEATPSTAQCRACRHRKPLKKFGKTRKRDKDGEIREYPRHICYSCVYKKRAASK